MQNNFKLFNLTIIFLLSLCALTFMGNVFYTIQNQNLTTSVNDNFDEKASLRAKFLTRISAHNLTHSAGDFAMTQALNNQIFKVKKDEPIKTQKDFWANLGFTLTKEIIVAGY